MFSTVLHADLLSGMEALKCIGLSTGLCTLASALCSGQHILGVKRYSPALFWLGMSVLAVALSIQASRQAG